MKIRIDRGYIHFDQDKAETSINAQKASLLTDVLNDSFTSGVDRIIRYSRNLDGNFVGQFEADGEIYGFIVNPTTMSVQTGLVEGGINPA